MSARRAAREVEGVMEQLYLLTKVRRGLALIEAGQVIEHREARRPLGR